MTVPITGAYGLLGSASKFSMLDGAVLDIKLTNIGRIESQQTSNSR